MAVGVSRAALEFAADYAATRVQFGRPIGQNQAIAFMLADMQAAWTRRGCSPGGRPGWRGWDGRSSTPRLHLEAGRGGDRRAVTDQAIQILGGNGYTATTGRAMARDAKIFTIFEGTSEIQRMIIGRAVTGLDVR